VKNINFIGYPLRSILMNSSIL